MVARRLESKKPTGRKPSTKRTTAANVVSTRRPPIAAATHPQRKSTEPVTLAPAPYRVGRPTKYRVELCQDLIDAAARGLTLGAACAVIGITPDTMNEWKRLYPEFSEAITRAKNIRQLHYESQLVEMSQTGGDSSRFNAIRFALINVAPDDWKEKFTHEQSVSFSLGLLIEESMKIDGSKPHTIEDLLIEQPKP